MKKEQLNSIEQANIDTLEDIDRLLSSIKFHRKKAKLSQYELAQLAGVGKTAVFDIEHGKKSVQVDTLMKVLRVLNIRIKIESPLIKTNFTMSRRNESR